MDAWRDCLVCFDTDRIKEYVFATNRLKEIRGASALLAELDAERQQHLETTLGEDRVVYSAGGGGAVLVGSKDEAERLIVEIERELQEQTESASITGVSLPPEPANGRQFGKRMKLAGGALRTAKAQKAELTALPVEPYMRLCDLCGQYAIHRRAEDEKGDLLCRSCFVKRKEGATGRSKLYDDFRKWTEQQGDAKWAKVPLPDDLDAIGRVSFPSSYVGFIALDGNQIGNLLDKLDSVDNYRVLAKELADLTRNATFDALKEFGPPRSETAPFEIVLIGGDDVLLITAADIALEVARHIVRHFEEESPSLLEKVGLKGERERLTMAGGVVLAHANFPISAMYELAEALQKSAKKLCRDQKYTTGALDFFVASSSGTDLDQARAAIPHRRPYTLSDIDKLIDQISKFKQANFPTSQLQKIYQSLFEESSVPGTMAILTALGRLKSRPRQALKTFLMEAFPPRKPEFGWPWEEIDGQDNRKRRTALVDLVEMYPFVRAERG
jgi:CRISPR/Cas system-associated protein Cas10 (large subunit of type III CRISPR-Cas system)